MNRLLMRYALAGAASVPDLTLYGPERDWGDRL
jgi:hypothetical protein